MGEPSPGLSWLPLNKAADGSAESYIVRFAPGAASRPHEHAGYEEFLVMDGELIDCDGAVYKAGDYVCFEPGSRHTSTAPGGCTLLVFVHGGSNQALPPG